MLVKQDAKLTLAFTSPFFYMLKPLLKVDFSLWNFLLEESCADCGEGDSSRLTSVTYQRGTEDRL